MRSLHDMSQHLSFVFLSSTQRLWAPQVIALWHVCKTLLRLHTSYVFGLHTITRFLIVHKLGHLMSNFLTPSVLTKECHGARALELQGTRARDVESAVDVPPLPLTTTCYRGQAAHCEVSDDHDCQFCSTQLCSL